MFQCHPVAHYWNDAIPGHCISIHSYVSLAYLYSAVSVATDLIFALLPAFIIWHLQIRSDIRLVLIFLMGLGCVASVAVFVRVAYLHTFYDADFLWATTDIAIWSTIEMGLALTAASCSTLRPLARSLGLNIGFTDYASAASEDAQNQLRRPSQPVNRRRSELGGGVLNTPGTSQDTLNPYHTRDKSDSSQVIASCVAPRVEHANETGNTDADLERAAGGMELSPVNRTMDYSTSRKFESRNAS
ncbi:hypothetical protein V2A60_000937 [Cordyceps javanica]